MIATLADDVATPNASDPYQAVNRAELSPLGFLRRAAAVYPDKAAFIHGNRGTVTTYREFQDRVNRLIAALVSADLRPGDRVAYLCPNSPAVLEAYYGVPAAGGVLTCINTRLNTQEIAEILVHSGARILFCDAELQPLIAPLDLAGIQVIRIDDTGAESDPYEQFLAGGFAASVQFQYPLADENETIAINYTSGTTGKSKGVVYSHRGAYLMALANVIEVGLTGDTVYLWTGPLFHASGWCFPWAVTAVAGTHVLLRKIDYDLIWDLIAAHGVTHYHAAPTVHLGIVNHPNARRLDRPVTVVAAAAPPSPTLLARLRDLNFRAIHFYGATETYAPATICAWHREWDELPDDEQARLLARQGVPYLSIDGVRVVDEEMRDVPRDGQAMGEVVMRGNTVMKGYFNDPAATEIAFAGGWYHSGDLAVMHPDGYIEVRDRKKDIVISGGENISTIEVEQTVVRHPAVLECSVIAAPDDRWGERPKAFVTLKAGATATEAEIIAFCRERLAHFKCPAAVEFGDLPKTSTGKVQKFLLREREWAGREKRVN
jgi:fatty-acyl-CoA synthase